MVSFRHGEANPFTHVHHFLSSSLPLKILTQRPNANLTILIASPTPRHPFIPVLIGDNTKPSHSPTFKNLSSLNWLGCAHNLGLLCIAHIFTNNIAPCGTRKFPTMHSFNDSWGTNNGYVGYICKILLMMPWR